jgi:protein-L-isoaspartate(D-aspartate) O-methyltransferase
MSIDGHPPTTPNGYRGAVAVVGLLIGLSMTSMLAAAPSEDPALTAARRRMVERQLAARDITDPRVLGAMAAVPRHLFVEAALRSRAYDDHPLPIGEGQTISQPYVVALMTQLLGLEESSRVLEVGTGSGYQAAVLAELAGEVYTIEILPGLAAAAGGRLRTLGYTTVRVRTGDGYRGWPEAAPFQAIMVTAGASRIPPPLVEQLAEGGTIVIPVDSAPGVQELVVGRKQNGRLLTRTVAPVRFVPLIEPR